MIVQERGQASRGGPDSWQAIDCGQRSSWTLCGKQNYEILGMSRTCPPYIQPTLSIDEKSKQNSIFVSGSGLIGGPFLIALKAECNTRHLLIKTIINITADHRFFARFADGRLIESENPTTRKPKSVRRVVFLEDYVADPGEERLE